MLRSILFAALILCSRAMPVSSQVVPIPQPQPRGCLPCPPDSDCRPAWPCVRRPSIYRTASHVRTEVDGHVVRYEVTETYVNRGSTVGEADYLLPLPKHAAFEELALSINGEMVTGETMNADRARGVYEEIVRRMRDPALVEWMGYGLLRTRIFPIQPGEEKRVVVRFRAVAEREGDALRVDWIGATRAGDSGGATSFTLAYADGDGYGDVYSPTHGVQLSHGAGQHLARVDGVQGPLTLLLPIHRGDAPAVSLLAHAPAGDDGYALITVSPPTRATRQTPRDVTFVVDVSGSMSGPKIEQARAAERQLLHSLTPADRFRLIDFSSDVRTFRDGWTTATDANLRDALRYVNGLRANGGTNIQGALEEALATETSAGRLPLVLFLTDGAPTVGETRPEVIAQRAATLRGERRVFTFGIGADVNAGLLEQLALQGRGTATFVRPEESVERAVSIVAERLTRPVATDVRIRVDGVRVYGMQPQGAIDLFAGQDLVVLARYAGARQNAVVTIEGHTPDGLVRWTGRGALPAHSADNAFVARLWAVQRVGYLSAERRRNGGNAELDGELRTLGERFGIPTELTSYLVQEPNMAAVASGGTIDRMSRRVVPSGTVGNAAPSSAPASDTYLAAKTAAEQRGTTSLGYAAERDRTPLADARHAGTHLFVLRDSVWVDTRPLGAARVVRVRAFSDAYFALVRRLPELSAAFAVGERIRVQGHRVAIEITPDGVSSLDPAALDAVARDW